MNKKAQNKLIISRKHILRKMLINGEVEEAGMRAAEWGIELADVRINAFHDAPAEVIDPDSLKLLQEELIPNTPPPPAPLPSPEVVTEMTVKWPAETDLVITAHPINARLVAVRLPDYRKALMWRRGGRFPIGCMVKGRLCDQVGPEAYYEPAYS